MTGSIGLWLLACGGLFIAYTYAGYPLLLWFWSRVRSREVQRTPNTPRVSAIVPFFNDKDSIAKKCRNLLEQDYPPDLVEVILVSDGSTDGSVEEARAVAEPRVKILEQPLRQGKAAALNRGVTEATGKILVFGDARQEFEPQAIRNLIENFADPSIGAVGGEMRFHKPATAFAKALALYWNYEKWVRKQESRIDSVCGISGCIWAIRSSLFRSMPHGLILDDVYQPMQVIRQGYRVILDERAVAWDYPTKTAEAEFQRKRRTLLGNFQLLEFLPWLPTLRNRIWLQFISHKLCRLLVPLAMLMILAGSWMLPHPLARAFFFLQLAGYALALVDPILPVSFPLRRLSGSANFFLIVHLGAIAGLVFWLFGVQNVWTRALTREGN